MARLSHVQLNRMARQQAVERQRNEAKHLAMLSIQGGYEPPGWVLQRMRKGDLYEYLTAKRMRAEGRPSGLP